MPNLSHAIMQCPQVGREMSSQIIQNNWRMFKIVVVDQSANFVMDCEHVKSRTKEATNELTNLINSLKLNLNKEPMKGNDVNDQPTPIVKLPQAHEYAQ